MGGETGGRDAGRSPRETGVSAREAEVLAAVGEHLTNAEIGAKLFISIRTVESHVSSLLRKLQADDRRALIAIAANLATARADRSPATLTVGGVLPTPLTPFVGRSVERAELSAALRENRLVTALGPGGVGKTRLALRVAADMGGQFADGVWYVDLVPVTDPVMLPSTIATALGLAEPQGRDPGDTVLSWLADRHALLVLDNCEHLLDSVVVWVERLLAGASRLVVLATSRARLMVPFERVFPVPGLAVDAQDGGTGDAVQLFLGRAAAAGTAVRPEDTDRVADICRSLDGMALAIELAAARYPSLGLHGLEAGLSDRLRLLTGGPRVDDRHRSLRSTIDWSYELLDPAEQAVVRRMSVFTEAFTAAAAARLLADWPPVPAGDVALLLGGLAEKSLLVAISEPAVTRYRALETIRQYGADRLQPTERNEGRRRHLDWCLESCADLASVCRDPGAPWRTAFDDIADELRGGLAWAVTSREHREDSYRLALALADLTFLRGLPAESQRRYEQAAEVAADDLAAADAWRSAAAAADSRSAGDDGLRLRLLAVEAALRAGDRAGAAADLALNAERINRAMGTMATRPAFEQVPDMIARGRALAGGDPRAEALLLVAEAFDGADADPGTALLVERALVLARRLDDPRPESAALDQLTGVQLARGDVRAAAASAMRRLEILAPLQISATTGFEFFDGYVMAVECAVAAGDLAAARRLAERLRDLPFYREEAHAATARLLPVTLLSGDWSEALALADRFRDGWEHAGRPRVGNLSRGAYAAATVHGLRGDEAARATWLDIVRDLQTPGLPPSVVHFTEFFDAMLLLHRGFADQTVRLMSTPPEEFDEWFSGLWRPWYAALWVEAAVLSGSDTAADRVPRGRIATAGNPIATAIVNRSAALTTPTVDRDGLIAAAVTLQDAGCRYQWARTLVMLGGEDRSRGESALAEMGAAPMAWPPG